MDGGLRGYSTKDGSLLWEFNTNIGFPTVNGFFGIGVFPSVDAISEFKMMDSNYSAEFGQAGNAIMNVTMKSGTNQYHGTAYEYLVNEFMNSGQPIYGMNCGSVGFLMNEFREESLRERLRAAIETVIHPLAMRAVSSGRGPRSSSLGCSLGHA